MNTLLLVLVVLAATAMWPLNRWAMRREARPESLGLAMCAVGAAAGLVLAVLSHQRVLVPATIALGAAAGVAYSVGFVLIILFCLRIGPAGPTVTANNLGLLWPVVVSLVGFSGGALSSLRVWLGAAATLAALILIGCNRSSGPTLPVTRRWARWVLAGWAFSGLSMTSQFLNSRFAPDALFAYVLWTNLFALLVLLGVSVVRRRGRPRGDELAAGAGSGLMATGALSLTLLLLGRLPAAVVYPVTVAGPVVLMLLIGHFVLKEHLGAAGWLAGALGVAGLALLSVP